ncbi:MAG: RNA methyltransferase [Polyangiaceae bacterium]|nr:RNA methyltransferase [Myxococcales bacterium]MCB9590368.1 RNA methyltransferase [Polyangiaceae bacterium]
MKNQRRVAAALVHYPVLDRQGGIVTTAITNLDIHDISRSAHTFGLSDYFLVHPVAAQRELAARVRDHWLHGPGGKRIPDRQPPMRDLRIVESLDQALESLGPDAELWTTSAKVRPENTSYDSARQLLTDAGPPVLLVFGTGWGLPSSVEERAKRALEPIGSPREDGFNHLSVRAAAAITFWRLLGN